MHLSSVHPHSYKQSVKMVKSFCVGYFLIAVLFFKTGHCDEHCQVPLGIKTPALPPDDRYTIDIKNIGDIYVPNQNYSVILQSRNESVKFIAFTISATGDTAPNPDNPRRPKSFLPGQLLPLPDEGLTTFGECNNTIIQTNVVPKTSVKVTWRAPPKGNHCVTIHAMVAIRQDMYYSGLTRHVCEDERKREDMPPEENTNCTVDTEARYKMTFEGLWSYNTHRPLYPTSNASTPSFSDIVGASHNKEYAIFNINNEASKGVKSLAEQGNTTELEMELQEKIGSSVRTIIKATRPPATNATTTATFRVSREYHLVSMVTAILPSPDWFLGASKLELCSADSNTWTDSITYNLYPLDAGIDKGMDFNSANDVLIPAQPIRLTQFVNAPKDKKPFAKVHFKLIRTYERPPGNFETFGNIEESEDRNGNTSEDENTENGGESGDSNKSETTAATSSEAPLVTDSESSSECPMTTWSGWGECEGSCENGQRSGYHNRERYHMVNNLKVTYDDEELAAQIPDSCKDLDINDFEKCTEACEETTTAETITQRRVAPGQSWRMWFN